MKKVFLDANIVIDYMDADARDHAIAVECISIIRNVGIKPFISPITFIIANYIFGKITKNKTWLKKQLHLTFSEFEFTSIHADFLDTIMKTHFTDLEDALQNECAMQVNAHAIITKDLSDFFDSKIPVVHPMDFVSRYYNQ